MSRIPVITVLGLLFLFSCNQVDEAAWQNLRKLEGKWYDADNNYHENWALKNGILMGKGLTIALGDTLFSEELKITNSGGRIEYIANPEGQNDGIPISYPLGSRKPDEFHFENPDHDFPNRIIYELLSDSSLRITVENSSKTSGFKLKLIKVSR